MKNKVTALIILTVASLALQGCAAGNGASAEDTPRQPYSEPAVQPGDTEKAPSPAGDPSPTGDMTEPGTESADPTEDPVTPEDKEIKEMDVNEEIEKLQNSSEYKAASLTERIYMAENLLRTLSDAGCVSDFNYDMDSHMFYFTYSDGLSGGIYLEDFTDDSDLLMN